MALEYTLPTPSQAPAGRVGKASQGSMKKPKKHINLPPKGRGAAKKTRTKAPACLPPPPGTSRRWWDDNWHLVQEAMLDQAGVCVGKGKGKGKAQQSKGGRGKGHTPKGGSKGAGKQRKQPDGSSTVNNPFIQGASRSET